MRKGIDISRRHLLTLRYPPGSTMNTETVNAAKKEAGDAYVLVQRNAQDHLEEARAEKRKLLL